MIRHSNVALFSRSSLAQLPAINRPIAKLPSSISIPSQQQMILTILLPISGSPHSHSQVASNNNIHSLAPLHAFKSHHHDTTRHPCQQTGWKKLASAVVDSACFYYPAFLPFAESHPSSHPQSLNPNAIGRTSRPPPSSIL